MSERWPTLREAIDRERELEDEIERLKKNIENLKKNLIVDDKTDIYNHRYFLKTGKKEFERAKREKIFLGVLLIDIDYFKQYNDLYGHLAGDECLKKVAQAIRGVLKRPADFVARVGGEEFGVVLPNTKNGGLAVVAKQVQEVIRELKITHEGSKDGILTVSIGGVSLIPGVDCSRFEELVDLADKALYSAKNGGRDCYVIVEQKDLIAKQDLIKKKLQEYVDTKKCISRRIYKDKEENVVMGFYNFSPDLLEDNTEYCIIRISKQDKKESYFDKYLEIKGEKAKLIREASREKFKRFAARLLRRTLGIGYGR